MSDTSCGASRRSLANCAVVAAWSCAFLADCSAARYSESARSLTDGSTSVADWSRSMRCWMASGVVSEGALRSAAASAAPHASAHKSAASPIAPRMPPLLRTFALPAEVSVPSDIV